LCFHTELLEKPVGRVLAGFFFGFKPDGMAPCKCAALKLLDKKSPTQGSIARLALYIALISRATAQASRPAAAAALTFALTLWTACSAASRTLINLISNIGLDHAWGAGRSRDAPEKAGSADLARTISYNLLKMILSIESITCVRTEGVLMFQYGAKFPI
jgi:hypothetical protein